MKLSIEELIRNSFVISIDKEREAIFRRRFNKYIGMVPRVFGGFKVEGLNGRTNIMASHAAIVKMAKAMDWPFVCIFEDDAYPCRDIKKVLPEILSDIPDDAKLLYLGWVTKKKWRGEAQYNAYISSISAQLTGSHAWVVFKSGYDAFLERCGYVNKHIDIHMGHFDKAYYVTNPVFIQASDSSTHGHPGYSGGQCGWNSPVPPEGFDVAEDMADGAKKMELEKHSVFTQIFCSRLTRSPQTNCLIIGSNPSILGARLQDYVDGFNGDVIRINSLPLPEYKPNYGSRTDILFTSQWSLDNINNTARDIDKIAPHAQCISLEHQKFIDIASYFSHPNGKWLTDGCACIMLALEVYKKVEVMGFGSPDIAESGMYQSIHHNKGRDMNSRGFPHDLNWEHRMIGDLEGSKLEILDRNRT